MERISHPTSVSGRFTDGDPGTSTPATTIIADFLNQWQDELIGTIEEAGLTPAAADVTQLQQAISRLATKGGGLKNQVGNGDFRVWQRGSTFAGLGPSPTYTADRWEIAADGTGGSGVATVSKQGFAVGQTDVPGATSFLRYSQTTGSDSGGGKIATKLEVLQQAANGDVTVTCHLKATSAITVTASVVQDLGQSEQIAGSSALSLTTSWQEFTFTVACPTLSGQSLGTNPNLRLEFALPTGTPQVDIARVQLELASVASSFEVRPLALEAALCQRYFEKSYPLDVAPGTITYAGAQAGLNSGDVMHTLGQRFRVPKRVSPTMAWYAPTSSDTPRILQESGTTVRVVTDVLDVSTTSTGRPRIDAAFPDIRSVFGHWTAEAEL